LELLRLHNFNYDLNGTALFRQVSFNVQKGQRLALIGNNGTGKTTLLRFLVERRGFEGAFRYAPALQISSCGILKIDPQLKVWDVAKGALEPIWELELNIRNTEQLLKDQKDDDENLEATLETYAQLVEQFEAIDAYNAEKKLKNALKDLGFKDSDFEKRVEELSGGQQQRLALVTCLQRSADLYLLDEPSNFLDLDAKAWLVEKLKACKSFIIASHDRALIDKTCGYVLELKDIKLKRFRGNYSRYRSQRSIQLKSLGQRKTQAQKEYDNLVVGMRKLKTGSRQHFLLRKRLEKLESEIHGLQESLSPDASLPSGEVRQQRRKGALLRAEKLSYGIDEQMLFQDVKFQLTKGDKLAFVGKNGIGKSSFFDVLAGKQESTNLESKLVFHIDSRVGYFDQEHRGLVEDLTLIEQFEQHVSKERAEMLLSLVGLAERWHDMRDRLSLGERARAGLALIMASEANILILDEPSEGLDIGMVEKLEEALVDSEAAIIFSSHDEHLVSAVANRVCSFEDAEFTEYRGGLQGYYKKQYRLEKDSDAVDFVDEFEVDEVVSQISTRQSVKDKRDSLENELTTIDKKLLDPFQLAEREYDRLMLRQREIIDELSVYYDELLPTAFPTFELKSKAMSIVGDAASKSRYHFTDSQKHYYKLLIQEGIGHVVPARALSDGLGLCLLKEIAFERLGAKALQVQTNIDLKDCGFKDAGSGWWLAQRGDFERELIAGFPVYERLRLEPRKWSKKNRRKKSKKTRNKNHQKKN